MKYLISLVLMVGSAEAFSETAEIINIKDVQRITDSLESFDFKAEKIGTARCTETGENTALCVSRRYVCTLISNDITCRLKVLKRTPKVTKKVSEVAK